MRAVARQRRRFGQSDQSGRSRGTAAIPGESQRPRCCGRRVAVPKARPETGAYSPTGGPRSGRHRFGLRLDPSSSIRPSRMRMIRCACWATARSCVTRMIVIPAGVQFLKHAQDLFARPRIEISGRFVGQHERRTIDQRAGDGDALLLSAGHLARLMMHAIAESHVLQQVAAPTVRFPIVRFSWPRRSAA